MLALLGSHRILHVSRIRVKLYDSSVFAQYMTCLTTGVLFVKGSVLNMNVVGLVQSCGD